MLNSSFFRSIEKSQRRIVYDQDGREVMRHPKIGQDSILWVIDRAIARGYYAIIDGDAFALEAEE